MSDLAPIPPQDRLALIERNTAELLTRDELVRHLESGLPLRHYIGFEVSGRIHLGTGLVCMTKIRDFQRAGVECSVLLADWHTWINDKLGGDREVIRRVARGYFEQGLRASLRCVGGDPDAVRFVLGSELYSSADDYWATVIEVAKHTSLARMQRSISILGRSEGEQVDFAKLIYPAMQAADIFFQGVNLAHAGMDQRKAHVIARDCALQLRTQPVMDGANRPIKPMAVHHPLILGLGKPPMVPTTPEQQRELFTAMKMSKSKPNSAVFVTDPPDVIRRKVAKAYCPPGDATLNPVLDWLDKLVFATGGGPVRIERSAAHGGAVVFEDQPSLERAYLDGALHPGDAKNALATWLIDTLEPARRHFADPAGQSLLEELDTLLG